MASRAELINQLAASMGANTVNTKSVDSRYDTKTGTLYSDCSRWLKSRGSGNPSASYVKLISVLSYQDF